MLHAFYNLFMACCMFVLSFGFLIIALSITPYRFIKFILKNIDIFNPYCVEIFTTLFANCTAF